MNRSKRRALGVAAALTLTALAGGAQAQTSDFFLGQLQQFGASWCPRDWVPANGQLLSIAQNSALFSLYGTTYGGDGVVTFALPNLQGRAPISYSNITSIGEPLGQSQTTLLQSQLPTHSHTFSADPTGPVGPNPAGAMLGMFPSSQSIYAAASNTPATPLKTTVLTLAGNSMPMPTQSPVLATVWCIATTGVFPSRP